MTSHENEPASSQPLPADRETGTQETAPQSGDLPPAPRPAQSGRTVLLHWCLLIAGMGAIALAVWLLG